MSNIQERLNELDRVLEELRMPLDMAQRQHAAEQAIYIITRTANAIYAELKGLRTLSEFRVDGITEELADMRRKFVNRKSGKIEDQYASTSRVERIAEDLAELRREMNIALANGHEESKQVNDRLDKLEGASTDSDAYIKGIGNDIKYLDHRVWELEEQMDYADGWNTGNATSDKTQEQPADTSWHPFNFSVDLRPANGRRVVVLTRNDDIIGPQKAEAFNWGDCWENTIIAWRYAKEGE